VAAQVLLLVPQVPLVSPGGMSQRSPAQQSPFTVQEPDAPTQGATHWPPSQEPEQHCESVVQPFPVGAQAEQVPVVPPGADGTQAPEQHASAGDEGVVEQDAPVPMHVPTGSRQNVPLSPTCWHVVPEQHGSGLAGVQATSRGTQEFAG
jgi:hypothetical protein